MKLAPGKIDLHTHIIPETWPDLNDRYGADGYSWLTIVQDRETQTVDDGDSFDHGNREESGSETFEGASCGGVHANGARASATGASAANASATGASATNAGAPRDIDGRIDRVHSVSAWQCQAQVTL